LYRIYGEFGEKRPKRSVVKTEVVTTLIERKNKIEVPVPLARYLASKSFGKFAFYILVSKKIYLLAPISMISHDLQKRRIAL
jgi:hypothetical protein